MNNATIRETIFDLFRSSKCKVGHMVPMRTIRNIFYKQQVDFTPVVEEIRSEGLVKYKDGSLPGLFLTQKGYDLIYTCRSDAQLIDLLMSQFRKTNCKAGQGFMFRTLQYTVMNSLNPKEEIRFIELCNQMITEGNIVVEFENDRPQFVKLTEKGSQMLYG